MILRDDIARIHDATKGSTEILLTVQPSADVGCWLTVYRNMGMPESEGYSQQFATSDAAYDEMERIDMILRDHIGTTRDVKVVRLADPTSEAS